MGLRDALHLGGKEPPPDAHHPHAFKRQGDAWVANGVPPSNTVSSPDTGMAAAATIAGLQFADQHCAVCGRAASDRIHGPAD